MTSPLIFGARTISTKITQIVRLPWLTDRGATVLDVAILIGGDDATHNQKHHPTEKMTFKLGKKYFHLASSSCFLSELRYVCNIIWDAVASDNITIKQMSMERCTYSKFVSVLARNIDSS